MFLKIDDTRATIVFIWSNYINAHSIITSLLDGVMHTTWRRSRKHYNKLQYIANGHHFAKRNIDWIFSRHFYTSSVCASKTKFLLKCLFTSHYTFRYLYIYKWSWHPSHQKLAAIIHYWDSQFFSTCLVRENGIRGDVSKSPVQFSSGLGAFKKPKPKSYLGFLWTPVNILACEFFE